MLGQRGVRVNGSGPAIWGSSSVLEGAVNTNMEVQQSWSSHRSKWARRGREPAGVRVLRKQRDVGRRQPLKRQGVVA